MTARRWAVIGSNSFTGSHIIEALLGDGATEVIGISRSPEYAPMFLPYKRHDGGRFQFHQIDMVRQFEEAATLLDRLRPSVVVNVAALSEVGLSNERPTEYFDINTTAVVRLCNHLRTCDYLERYVHISSAEILGSCQRPMAEDAPFQPSTPYAVSKAAADHYLNVLIRNFGFPATMIRSTNVYGAHQQLFKIIPRTIIYLRLGRTIELHGGGHAIKHFVHIRDVVRGLVAAVERGGAGTYHFTSANSDTVARVVARVCAAMGYGAEDVTCVIGERLGQDARYWLDCSKAERELGWREQEGFDQGVRETITWVDEYWDEIQRAPLTYVHKV